MISDVGTEEVLVLLTQVITAVENLRKSGMTYKLIKVNKPYTGNYSSRELKKFTYGTGKLLVWLTQVISAREN